MEILVSIDANDRIADGSKERPFRSLVAAIRLAKPDDVIQIVGNDAQRILFFGSRRPADG